jgi:hypothetical protein
MVGTCALGWCFTALACAYDAPEANAMHVDQPTNLKLQTTPDTTPEADTHNSGGNSDLAKKLSNPVADLISIPIQMNFNFGGGFDIPERHPLLRILPRPAARLANRLLHDDRNQATRFLMNVQSVIPFSISQDWNLITRTIIPVVYQNDFLGTSSQGGMGDIVQSFFFSPKEGDIIWGVGPVFLWPTATDDSLGGEKWGAGPTAVVLKQDKGWTYGALANHIWSYAGAGDRENVNLTFLQPFVSYTWPTATTVTFNTESTYDWDESQWTVPIFAGVSQIIKIGKLPVQLQLGGQYWVEGPDSAPDWSIRFAVTLLFPR